MDVIAKFKITSVSPVQSIAGDGMGTVELEVVTSGSPENETFFKWTPFGRINMGTVNKEAFKQFVDNVGKEVFVRFEFPE